MSRLRQTAAKGVDVACRAAGRRQIVRAARFVLNRARLDIPNDLLTNGESSLQLWVLEMMPICEPVHIFDVGANIGRWSESLQDAARIVGRKEIDLHLFEPSAYTFNVLASRFNAQTVHLQNVAVSERSGSATLHVAAPGAGTNSLHEQPQLGPEVTQESVTITTLDSYAELAKIDQIALLKIDTEGHDLAVLRGAQGLIADHRISVAQFEYNHRWIYSRSYLRDAFDLLEPHGYRIGKLTPYGIEFYPLWDIDLETFVEGNYVACLPQLARRLPTVSWWKITKGSASCV